MSFYAVTNGFFDEIPTEKVRKFENDLIKNLEGNKILEIIKEKKEVTDELKELMNEYITEYRQNYIW